MKPVDQTRFGKPHGNCYAACIASVFEVLLEDLPRLHMVEDNWENDLEKWLEPRGFVVISMGYPKPRDIQDLPDFQCVHLAIGDNPDGVSHCVVVDSGKIVHDPNPSRRGILNVRTLEFFVTKDPARTTQKGGCK